MKLWLGSSSVEALLPWVRQVIQGLQIRYEGLEIEIAPIQTSGEREAAEQPEVLGSGKDDLLTREVDAALLAGTIDFAVHRGQDLPVRLPEGLCIAAYLKREDPREVFVPRSGIPWAGFGSGRLAVSSLRRGLQIRRARPSVELLCLRGSVSSRLGRLEQGYCDAMVLAGANWTGLGLPPQRAESVPVEDMVPAPGQGSLVLVTRLERKDIREMLRVFDDPATRIEVEFERALLRELGPEHAVTLAVLARSTEDGVSLSVFHSLPDGSRPLRLRRTCREGEGRASFIGEIVEAIQRSC
ncbi:MAG: hydroxymethylbilane synthase [Elusimicrobiota bacterium]